MFQRSDQLDDQQLEALRRQQRDITATVARDWQPEVHAGPISSNYGYFGKDKYSRLGGALFLSYLADKRVFELAEKYPMIAGASVANGFEVTARIIGYAPEAYATYCSQKDKQATPEHLGAILRKSMQTIWFFTDCTNETNKTLELWFGLKMGKQTGDAPFEIIDSGDTEILSPAQAIIDSRDYAPDLSRALGEQAYTRKHQPYRSCSGKAVIAKLWSAAIDICTTDPAYFNTDITANMSNLTTAEVQ